MGMKVGETLVAAANTYLERNMVYQDAWTQVGPLLAALFPAGISLQRPNDFTKFHLLVMIMVKLSRFANSGMQHPDSVRDIITHAAMLEAWLQEHP
jgi:hypothetical protein